MVLNVNGGCIYAKKMELLAGKIIRVSYEITWLYPMLLEPEIYDIQILYRSGINDVLSNSVKTEI